MIWTRTHSFSIYPIVVLQTVSCIDSEFSNSRGTPPHPREHAERERERERERQARTHARTLARSRARAHTVREIGGGGEREREDGSLFL